MQLSYNLGLTSLRRRAGGAAPSYLLDAISASDIEAAYSLRRVRTAYGGGATDYIVRVRRTSGGTDADVLLDPATQRITMNSPIDLAGVPSGTLGAWVGSDSAWITTDYDHSGRGRNATQGIVDRQKRLVDAGVLDTTVPGGSVVGAHTNTTAGTLQATVLPSFTAPAEPEIITYGYSAASNQPANWESFTLQNWFTFGGNGIFLDVWSSARMQFSPNPTANLLLNVGLFHSARRVGATGEEMEFRTTAPANHFASRTNSFVGTKTLSWGGSHAGRFNGRVSECFIFGRNLTTSERNAIAANQFAYWI